MTDKAWTASGAVHSLWRYPVKSMAGQELTTARVLEHGLSGDRAYGILDRSDAKIATAKNPRKWPTLLAFRSALVEPSAERPALSSLRITLPDGRVLAGDQDDLNQALSSALDRDVSLAAAERGRAEGATPAMPAGWIAKSEEYWPDIEGLDHRNTVTEFPLPGGTFFDCATIHLVTTASLERLHSAYPEGRFEVPRFRPNIVVDPPGGESGFVETFWIGRTLSIGDEVRLSITGSCGRCVMTTLPQSGLPSDPGILRTAVQQNRASVGVYASVMSGGTIRKGDAVRLSGD